MTGALGSLTWVGVDPGARWTGVVVRQADTLLWHRVVDRTKTGDATYLEDVEQALVTAAAHGDDLMWAIEDAVAPCGFRDGKKQFARPVDILALGQTLGWVRHVVVTLTTPSRIVLVRPGGHGRSLLRAYPEVLVTAAEKRGGMNRPAQSSAALSHARSAWDICGAAPLTARIEAARARVAR